MKTSAHYFHKLFADVIRDMVFATTRTDQDLWWKLSDDDDTKYDYICTWVYDIVICAIHPQNYMALIAKQLTIHNLPYISHFVHNDARTNLMNNHDDTLYTNYPFCC